MALTYDLDCPNCGKKIKLDFSNAGKGKNATCPHCKGNLHFSDNKLKELDDSYKKLLKTLKNFGKK